MARYIYTKLFIFLWLDIFFFIFFNMDIILIQFWTNYNIFQKLIEFPFLDHWSYFPMSVISVLPVFLAVCSEALFAQLQVLLLDLFWDIQHLGF